MNGIEPRLIVMADDNAEDLYLAEEALKTIGDDTAFRAFESGEALLDYLESAVDAEKPAYPDLVMLDVNMPRVNGPETLAAMRKLEHCRDIPVVMFSSSAAESDVRAAYRSGASSYVRKPESFDGLCRTLETLRRYWFETVEPVPR